MDNKVLDKDIIAIIEKKNQLSKLKYDDTNYDIIEDELHLLEDAFMDKYGDDFEEILEEVHEELCPDTDVLAAIAYIAPKYTITEKNGSPVYEAVAKEGVIVDVEKYADKDTRLVLIPTPPRFVLMLDGQNKEVVWKS